MFDLIVTDIKRVIKDKLFLVVCIIAVVLGASMPLLNRAVFGALDALEFVDEIGLDAKSMFFSAFLPSSDLGLLAPILLGVAICKDFTHGTVRNKIISGKSRTQIFFSMLITTCVVLYGVVLLYALVTLAVALCFFDYQAAPFTAGDFGYLMLSVLFSMLIYVFISALVSLFAVLMRSTGLMVVMYIAVNFFFSIVGGVTSVAQAFADPKNKLSYGALEFFNKVNVFTSGIIGSSDSYAAKDVLYIVLPTVVGGALLTLLGWFIFKKKDLK